MQRDSVEVVGARFNGGVPRSARLFVIACILALCVAFTFAFMVLGIID
jgi:hypothetical protein